MFAIHHFTTRFLPLPYGSLSLAQINDWPVHITTVTTLYSICADGRHHCPLQYIVTYYTAASHAHNSCLQLHLFDLSACTVFLLAAVQHLPVTSRAAFAENTTSQQLHACTMVPTRCRTLLDTARVRSDHQE